MGPVIRCPDCQAENVTNALYCNQCGTYLLEDEIKKTDPLDTEETGWLGITADLERGSPPRPDHTPVAIRLKIGPEKREVELPLDKPLLIGRTDEDADIFPEIDVTDDIAPDKSVSRRHAVITKTENKVMIEDVGSINGTFINSRKLTPFVTEPLKNGDTLQLGTLLIEVEIVTDKEH